MSGQVALPPPPPPIDLQPPPPPASELDVAEVALPPPSRFLQALSRKEDRAAKDVDAAPVPPAPLAPPMPASPPRFAFLKSAAKETQDSEEKENLDNSNEKEVGKVPSAPSKPKADAPDVISLRDSIQDRDECLAACTALEAATARSSALHRHVVSSGGVEALVEVMAAHRQDVDIQLAACHTLQHLAASAACHGAARVAEAGGCEGILLAMGSMHSQNTLLVQAAAQTLELVAFGGPSQRKRAVDAGAVEGLASVLKVHRSNADVQQAVLAALQTIVERDPDCQQIDRLAAADGISRIIASLGEHKADQQVQYWARLLLHDVCTENRELRTEALRKLHYQGIELEL